MQTWLIKTNQENLTLSLELQEQRALQATETKRKGIQAAETTANARLLEVENKFTLSEKERKLLKASTQQLQEELDIVSSKKRKLKFTLKATDSAAKARLSTIEDRLAHSENEREALYDDNTSLKAENAQLRTELEFLRSIRRQLNVTIQTNTATYEATLSDIDGKLIKSEYNRSALEAAKKSLQDKLKTNEELKCTLIENLESVTYDLEASERELLETIAASEHELLETIVAYDHELQTVKETCAKLSKSNTKFDFMCAKLTQALLAKQDEAAAYKREIARLSGKENIDSHAHG
jgi:chromosome segregation ATPase